MLRRAWPAAGAAGWRGWRWPGRSSLRVPADRALRSAWPWRAWSAPGRRCFGGAVVGWQAERAEQGRVEEDDEPRDPGGRDRQHLQGVRLVGAVGTAPVGGESGLPVGRRGNHPEQPRRREHLRREEARDRLA